MTLGLPHLKFHLLAESDGTQPWDGRKGLEPVVQILPLLLISWVTVYIGYIMLLSLSPHLLCWSNE